MNYHLTPQSTNKKVGLGVAVSTTSRESCPTSCVFYNSGCYAKQGAITFNLEKA